MVHFCERLGLRHRRQVVDAKLEAELLQVLVDGEGRVGQLPFGGDGRVPQGPTTILPAPHT